VVLELKLSPNHLMMKIYSERIPTSPSFVLSKVSLFILSYSMRF
jgi:hypothetical protein